MLNEDKFINCLEKIKCFKKEEDINFEEMTETFLTLKHNVNNSVVEEKQLEIINNFKLITQNHNDYLKVLEKTLLKYKQTVSDVENLLGNINIK